MTIDTSPAELVRIRRLLQTGAFSTHYTTEVVLALIDALEDARAKVEILEAEIRVMKRLPAVLDDILLGKPAP